MLINNYVELSGRWVPSTEREKKGGIVGGKQKIKKSTNTENNGLKKKQRLHNTLPNMVPNSRFTETAWAMWAYVGMHETADP